MSVRLIFSALVLILVAGCAGESGTSAVSDKDSASFTPSEKKEVKKVEQMINEDSQKMEQKKKELGIED